MSVEFTSIQTNYVNVGDLEGDYNSGVRLITFIDVQLKFMYKVDTFISNVASFTE